jgi:hypothetical protein
MRNRYKTILMTACMLSSALLADAQSANTTNAATKYTEAQWEHYAADNYAGGTGTAADPYLIATPEQLMKLAVEVENLGSVDTNWNLDYSKGKYWKQTADIVLNENVLSKVGWADGDASSISNGTFRTFKGIGYYSADFDYQIFAGTYDGGGHSISGMYINSGSTVGLFNLLQGAVVKNLTIKDTYISANANIGLIAGTAKEGSQVLNCSTSGIIYCGGSYHAGIVGNAANTKVMNCYTDVWTWAKNNVGGLVGKSAFSTYIGNCYFNGWLGAVSSNVAKMKYYGAICPELGKDETKDATTGTVANPTTAENCFWTDTCTVRHMSAKAAAYNDSINCTYGVLKNCKAVAVADASNIVDELNKGAQNIEGACKWTLGTNKMPQLVFDTATGISSLKTSAQAQSMKVYTLQGALVKVAQSADAAVEGLPQGLYIMNGRKLVVK